MQSILQKIQYILLICLVCSLPFTLGEIQLNSYLIILLAINTVLCISFSCNEKRYFHWIFILFIAYYLIHVLGLLKTDNLHGALFELQKKLSLLIFPFILFFSPALSAKQVRVILMSFVISCVLTGAFCVSVASYYLFQSHDSSFFYYHSLSGIVGMHATYLSMYCCFSIAILLSILFNEFRQMSVASKIIYSISLFFLMLLVMLLAARMQIIILILGIIAYSMFYFQKKYGALKALFFSCLVGVLILGTTLLFPKIRDRYKEGINYNIGNRWSEQKMRGLIWPSAFGLIKSYPIVGVGTGDVQDELQKYYIDHEYTSLTYLNDIQFNAHNQFLETAIGLGIPGLIVLLLCFFTPIYYAIKKKKMLYLAFILLFMLSCMTESLLERQSGVVFYSFFNALLFLNKIIPKGEY